jgi:hypothetical protein
VDQFHHAVLFFAGFTAIGFFIAWSLTPDFCRRQFVGEAGNAVCQASRFANKFAPTGETDNSVRQANRFANKFAPTGETDNAVCQANRFANKFAPTDGVGLKISTASQVGQETTCLRISLHSHRKGVLIITPRNCWSFLCYSEV